VLAMAARKVLASLATIKTGDIILPLVATMIPWKSPPGTAFAKSY
jgi:hypothetical protein